MSYKNNLTQSQIILNKTEDGAIKMDTIFQNEIIWLTQSTMAELFDVNVPAISKHLSNIYEEGELVREATLYKMETVQNDMTISSILEHATQRKKYDFIPGGKINA